MSNRLGNVAPQRSRKPELRDRQRRSSQHERVYDMSDDLKWDGLDRRDFITAAIGASAVLAANADSASAQTVGQATTASRGTVYTGDTIDGKKVINALKYR
jgi:hypothetical protein